jgi:hypothetical protein
MTDTVARLNEAADHLDWLYEGARHIPSDLIHDRGFRMGLVCTRNQQPGQTVAQFFYGGAAEVFLTLGPEALPLLSKLLRTTAASYFVNLPETAKAVVALADHILKAKGEEEGTNRG